MRISAAFPSDYLKAADLQDRNVRVAIDHVEMKDIGDDHKPILYFQGKDKGLVLNKTNANAIASAYGDDTDDWPGRELVLFPIMTEFQGKTVPAIRVRAPTAKDNAGRSHQAPAAPPPAQTRAEQGFDDEIPF